MVYSKPLPCLRRLNQQVTLRLEVITFNDHLNAPKDYRATKKDQRPPRIQKSVFSAITYDASCRETSNCKRDFHQQVRKFKAKIIRCAKRISCPRLKCFSISDDQILFHSHTRNHCFFSGMGKETGFGLSSIGNGIAGIQSDFFLKSGCSVSINFMSIHISSFSIYQVIA